jgi:site-specific DNA recombinase
MAVSSNQLMLDNDDIDLLDWLRHQADQNVPESFAGAAVPVAWLGRTSTEDAQDPTLSLPRQLENSRKALPPGFVIVAKFYDIESGRTTLENRGKGNAHEHLDIPIARDGGIADLLAEAKRPDRRFVAVVVESIERVARVTYFSTKIEFELEKAGVALLAADEGINSASIPNYDQGDAPYRKATPTLMRRMKQAIAEWYVLNMLELTWGGLKTHTAQGFNIGKPPYGYLAEKMKHPVKAKAHEGKTKHRLAADPVKGPVVTQIFLWRAVHRLGYDTIAHRLNIDLDRFPPPDPILGEGRRRIGAWTGSSVRAVLDNPKHTGYMVWNRRKRGHRAREVKGRVNPPSAWVWSPRPTHEPLVTREMFEAASTVGQFRQGSRTAPGKSTKPNVKRSYKLRSYVICDMCEHRYFGEVHKGMTYYRCSPNAKNHGHLPWFGDHPRAAYVREDFLVEPLDNFFRDRIFGAGREAMLAAAAATGDRDAHDALASRRTAQSARLTELQRRQDNLISELEKFEPSGDEDVDAALRAGIRNRFAAIVAEQRTVKEQLTATTDEERAVAPLDLAILDQLPQSAIDLDRLPEDELRALYDVFQLELRVHPTRQDLVVRVTVTGETAPVLTSTITKIFGGPRTLEASGGRSIGLPPGTDNTKEVRELLRDPGGAPRKSSSDLRR